MVQKIFINLFYAGQLDIDSASVRKQILICSIFNLTGFVLLFLYGTHAALQQNYPIAAVDFSVCVINALNYIYLRKTGNYKISSQVVVYMMGTLCLYLFCSGGSYQTGPLWSLMMPSLIFYILGLRIGRVVLTLFFLTILAIVALHGNIVSIIDYPPSFFFRFIGAFLSVSIIAYAYEYTLEDGRNELLSLNKKLDALSRIDSLTGLANRRDILERIEQEVSRYERSQDTFCVLMADIDNFKQINDNQDHAFGDLVLQKVGEVLSHSTQKRDCVARWGGEEFLILLTGTSIKDAVRIAERLRKNIAGLDCATDDIVERVTLSIGVAEYDKVNSVNELVKEADQLMYIAKSKGKNQVVSTLCNS